MVVVLLFCFKLLSAFHPFIGLTNREMCNFATLSGDLIEMDARKEARPKRFVIFGSWELLGSWPSPFSFVRMWRVNEVRVLAGV